MDNTPHFKDSVICERHWPKDYPKTIDYGTLLPHDPPSVFDFIKSRLLLQVPSVGVHREIRNIIPDKV